MGLSVLSVGPMFKHEEAELKVLIMGAVFHDFGFSYRPDWHYDVDNLREVYQGRNVMLAARMNGDVIGSIGLRMGAPMAIEGRYQKGDMSVAQIVRLVVRKDWRRHGIARHLVESIIPYAVNDPETEHLYFHTSDTSASAIPFWESMGATMIRDDRPREPITRTVHFEFDLAGLRAKAAAQAMRTTGIPKETQGHREPLVIDPTSAGVSI